MKTRTKGPTEHDVESEGLPSASGFDANFRCLGRWALCKKLPPEEDTAITNRGRRIHKALEDNDLSGLNDSDTRTASSIMYAEAKLVHEYDFEGAQSLFEKRLWDVDAKLNHLWSAKIDRHDWQPERSRLLVTDNKTGWLATSTVPLERNWQIKAGAAVAADQFDAQEVVGALIHPHHPDSLYEVKIFSREELMDSLDTIRRLVKAIQEPDQPRTVGGVQCKFCRAKRICPEFKAHRKAMEVAIADEVEDAGFTAIIRRSTRERGEHVRYLKDMQKNIEAELKQYVELMVRDGAAVDGYVLARKMLSKITNEQKAMEIVREAFGPDALYDALHFSLPDLEKHVAARVGAREAKAAVEKSLAEVLKSQTGEYFLREGKP